MIDRGFGMMERFLYTIGILREYDILDVWLCMQSK